MQSLVRWRICRTVEMTKRQRTLFSKLGNIERPREYSRMSGSCTTIWRCLQGGDKKCSDNSSKGSNWTLPAISSGLRTWPSFTPSSEEGMGVDSFSNIRCHQPCTGKTRPPSRDRERKRRCQQTYAHSFSLSLSSGRPPSHPPQS